MSKKTKKEERKITKEVFGDIFGLSSRERFIVKHLFDKETKTKEEWINVLVDKQIIDPVS